jgi:hypothetical protein
MAFCFPQRLSAFLNGFPIFLNGFQLSKKSKKIYLRQQVSERLLFELCISCHLLSELRNSCYNVYISPNTDGTDQAIVDDIPKVPPHPTKLCQVEVGCKSMIHLGHTCLQHKVPNHFPIHQKPSSWVSNHFISLP